MVDYAAEAASHGAVYLEGIFTPAEAVGRGASWEEVFAGFCDGAQEAREQHGVEVRLTPDIPRGYPMDIAELTARHGVAHRDRGIVGLGPRRLEAEFPPEPYAQVFALARDGGVPAVPHAGEAAGPASVRGALDALGAVRIRHGIRAVEDPALVAELAERGIVLDVCPVSNLRTGVVRLARRAPAARAGRGRRPLLGVDRRPGHVRHRPGPGVPGRPAARGRARRTATCAGVAGALCDEHTRAPLASIGREQGGRRGQPAPGGSA